MATRGLAGPSQQLITAGLHDSVGNSKWRFWNGARRPVAVGDDAGELGAGVDVELGVDVADVRLDGVDLHAQRLDELGIGQALDSPCGDLGLGIG